MAVIRGILFDKDGTLIDHEATWVPITIAILVGLFFIQSRGTGGIGKVFGPVMVLWFVTLSVLGVSWILREPGVLAAIEPSPRK